MNKLLNTEASYKSAALIALVHVGIGLAAIFVGLSLELNETSAYVLAVGYFIFFAITSYIWIIDLKFFLGGAGGFVSVTKRAAVWFLCGGSVLAIAGKLFEAV